MQRCDAKCWTYQGNDTIRCSLPHGHAGEHQTGGMFNTFFTEAEAARVKAVQANG